MAEIRCEGCGTVHPQLKDDKESYSIINFHSYKIVDHCCGAFIDDLYASFGQRFFYAFLADFEKDPLCREHLVLREMFITTIHRWADAAARSNFEAQEIRNDLQAIGS